MRVKPLTRGSVSVAMRLGDYGVKQCTLTKPLQPVSGGVHLQKNAAKIFDATDGLLPNMKVRDSFTSLCFLMHTNILVTFIISFMCH